MSSSFVSLTLKKPKNKPVTGNLETGNMTGVDCCYSGVKLELFCQEVLQYSLYTNLRLPGKNNENHFSSHFYIL